MVCDFLAVLVSRVGVENLFSAAQDICHYQQNCLAPEIIEVIMIQIYASYFILKKEFEFESDLNNNMDEYNKASHEADEVPPQQ